MNIDVTSVARKDQKLSRTPAAVYVITQEAIERSGATTIPDLLRLAPGVEVAQINASNWAISVRGFNGLYSNKLLVLVDGRTVYTPSFSGVYWDQLLEIPLDFIDRIEIVRGPGGAVWGANAVNGVINIITKHSSATQGTEVVAGAGSSQTGDYLAAYGGTLKKSYTYRVFDQFDSFAALDLSSHASGGDAWHANHGGFRLDGGDDKSAKNSFFAEGNFFTAGGSQLYVPQLAEGEQTLSQPVKDDGFDVTAGWTHNYSDGAQMSLRIYDNDYSREVAGVRERNNTSDVDFQDHVQLGSRHDVVWGAGYRASNDNAANMLGEASAFSTLGYFVQRSPASLTYSIFSAFFQDEIRIASNLSFTAGTKVDHNAFTGFGYDPSLRLAWTPTENSTFWMAASQASRQPSLLDIGLDVQFAPARLAPYLYLDLQNVGNRHFVSERMRDYEIGYRVVPNPRISFDVTGFFSLYRDLESGGLLPPTVTYQPDGVHAVVALQYQNGAKSEDYGAEFVSTWNVAPRWKLSGSYSWIRVLPRLWSPEQALNLGALGASVPSGLAALQHIQSDSTASSISSAVPPANQAGVQSYLDVSKKLSFDSSVFLVGRMALLNTPAYTRLDSRFSYKFNSHFAVQLAGQNLLSPDHIEFGNTQFANTQVPRSIFGNVVWKF